MLDGRPPEPEKDPAMLTRPRGCSESGGKDGAFCVQFGRIGLLLYLPGVT
jgi:hypothetical protein